MTRMFEVDSKRVITWNPVVGCSYACSYCYARGLALGRLKHLPRYQNGFKPTLVESEFKKRFHRGETVFVSSMGDLWAEDVPTEWILRVLEHIKGQEATFLFLTKNPTRYHEFELPPNCFAGATIESTYVPLEGSKAPRPWERYVALAGLTHPHKFVSIEPIMKFHAGYGPTGFTFWIKDIAPVFVYLGYDNYHSWNHLPEPSLSETLSLIEELEKITEVRRKTLRMAWSE